MLVTLVPALLQNAALLLAMALVYDLMARRYPADTLGGKLLTGVAIGLVGIAVIHSAFSVEPGIVFDTRSVLMAVCGLFLGLIPTLVAATLAIVFRLLEGGAALTGVAVILSSSLIGLYWRHRYRDRLAEIRFAELYVFGLAVHLVMLVMMLTLPGEVRWRVLASISVPVILVYPLVTAVLGAIFVARLQREQIQLRLDEERRLFRSLFESLPDIVFLKDKNGRYMACNQRLEDVFGAPSDSIIGFTDKDFVSPEMARSFLDYDNKVIVSGRPSVNEEWITVARDGRRILLETTKTPMFDSNGQVSGVLGIGHDITERKATEQQLRQLVQAVEQSTESIVITNMQLEIEYVNAAFLASSGYSRDEVIGRNPRFLQSGDTPLETYQQMWSSLAAGHTWQGEFSNRRKSGEIYIESAIVSLIRQPDGAASHYLAVKRDISQHRAAQARIDHLAHYDELTGLPNRVLFNDRLATVLAMSRQRRHQGALIIADLDLFKTINDGRGFAFGDALLQLVAGRLQSLLKDGDTVARLSADEFAILLPDLKPHQALDTGQHAEEIAEKIHAAFRNPLEVNGEAVTLSVSLGITLYPERSDDNAADVINRSETAMHRAKAAGGNQTAFFETEMGEQAKARYALESDLRRGLRAGELAVHLQSQVDHCGRIVGAEALLRWNHPQRGLVPPGIFIPIAEQSDLIVALGEWVLTQTCTLIAAEEAGGRSLRIAVNLSPRHFRKTGFVEWLKQLLARTGADPGRLTLEVTEGLMIDNTDVVVGKMHEIAALGVHFSVDDFGTGYSSLSYLKRLPIRELKIDKSFVQDLPVDSDDAALVETIIAVARNLKLVVVAEGVETQAQADFLNARGDIIHQGYLYGRPQPVQTWLEAWRQDGGSR